MTRPDLEASVNGHRLTLTDVSSDAVGSGHFYGRCSCDRWRSNVSFHPAKIRAWHTQHSLAAEPWVA